MGPTDMFRYRSDASDGATGKPNLSMPIDSGLAICGAAGTPSSWFEALRIDSPLASHTAEC